jgi:hypothetical protein
MRKVNMIICIYKAVANQLNKLVMSKLLPARKMCVRKYTQQPGVSRKYQNDVF